MTDQSQPIRPQINIGGEIVAPSVTLRDQIAMAALSTMKYTASLSGDDIQRFIDLRAELAYKQADAMLAVRAKTMAYKKKSIQK